MTVDWDGFVPFDPGVSRPLGEVSRREARAAFGHLIASKEDRLEQLRQLLAANGVALSASQTDLQLVNDWFRQEVEGDESGRLVPRWYAVVNDLALFLGEVVIARCPNISWQMFEKGKRDVAYQRHVLMGFSQVPNPNYNVDIDRLLAAYGHRIVAGQSVDPDQFRTWIDAACEKA